MKIRELTIENFRGIKRLDWAIPADKKLICLIGKGDSGKSTILDAIGWLLGSRWNLPVDVCDFNDEDKPILLKAVLSEMPASSLALMHWACINEGFGRTARWMQSLLTGMNPAFWSGSESTPISNRNGSFSTATIENDLSASE